METETFKLTSFDYNIYIERELVIVIFLVHKIIGSPDQSIGLVRKFLRFFRKFLGTAESVLEYSILGVYIDGMNTVRMTIKLSKWKLISN